MMSSARFSASRCRKMINLVKTDSPIQQMPSPAKKPTDRELCKTESPIPTACTFGDAEWAALEGIIDDELSSDTTWPPSTNLLENTFPGSPSNQESCILDSLENTPLPSPLQDFESPSPVIIQSSSPFELLETEPEDQNAAALPNSAHGHQSTHVIPLTPINSPMAIPSVESLITISDCDSPSANADINKKRKVTFKSNPGKKRKRCEEKWIDNKRKLLLHSGQAYTMRKGKLKDEKKIRPICPETCKLKCYERFDTETRQNIFTQFWKLSDHAKQWAYINQFSEKKKKKSVTIEGPSRRNFTTKYFLPLSSKTDQQHSTFEPVQVCLKTFLNTLCITDQIVRTAHAKLIESGVTLSDKRGNHSNHPVIKTAEMIKSVCDHVASFQPVESHYTRKSSDKLYLDNNLSMNKMFSLYKKWDQLQNYDTHAQTVRQYTDIVNQNMNIAFFVPKKDLCDKCHSFSNNKSPTEEDVNANSKHVKNKTFARELKQNDKQLAQSNPDAVCATFDFQKILNAPHGDIGLLYYKRKLSVYHFTVYDLAEREGFCYMWTECTGNRGANEVSSCLAQFIKTQVDKGVKKFLFWSDNCSGQNRNRVVYSMYMYLSQQYKIDITHRFLEPGHTQNEGDSVHALIEKDSKGKLIYTPDQWYALVRWAKTSGKPYNVVEVTQQDIYDYKPLLNERNWKKDTSNANMSWNKIKEIKVDKDVPNYLFFKYDLEGDEHCLNSVVVTRRRGQRINTNTELKMAYTSTLPITNDKYKDLISLCNSEVIPKEYHRFYKNICHGRNVEEDNSS